MRERKKETKSESLISTLEIGRNLLEIEGIGLRDTRIKLLALTLTSLGKNSKLRFYNHDVLSKL